MIGVSSPVQVSADFMPAVGKLLRLRFKILLNNFRYSKLISKVFTILALLGFLVLAGIIYWFTWQLVRFVRSPEFIKAAGDSTAMLDAVPALFLTLFTLGVFFTSFSLLLQALYLAGDMDFLVSAPIPMRAVFITKLLQAIIIPLGLGVMLGLPLLYGLGIARGYSLWYYPAVPLVMLALSLMSAGLAAILVMLVVRVFHYRRVAEVLGFAGAVFSFACSQTGNLMNATMGPNLTSKEQVVGTLSFLSQFNNPLLPLNWPGEGLVALGEGSWLAGISLTLLSLCISMALFWSSLQTAERWYYTGWAGMQVVHKKVRAARASRPAAILRFLSKHGSFVVRGLSTPVLGLIWKDALVLRRDLRHLSQLVTPLIFGVIYGIVLLTGASQPPTSSDGAPAWMVGSFQDLLSFSNIGLAVLVGWMLLGRLASMGFSSEGKNYWMLKAAPVSTRQLITAKFLVAYLPALGLSVLFLSVFSILQKLPVATSAYGMLSLIMSLAGVTGILLAFGVAGANFNWEDPRRNNAGKMGCMGSIVSIVYLPLVLAFFLGPLALSSFTSFSTAYAYLGGGLLGTAASLLGMLLPLRLVTPLVDHLDET